MVEAAGRRLRDLVRTGPFRVALAALAVLVPLAALFAGIIGSRVNDALADRTLGELRAELRGLRAEFDRGGVRALVSAVDALSTDAGPGLYRLSLPGDGDGPPAAGNLKNRPTGVAAEGGLFEVYHAADGSRHAAAGLVVPVPGGGELLVARDIEDERAFARGLQRIAFAAVGMLSLAALALGVASGRRALARVAGVTAATETIMAGDMTRRLPRDGSGDEIDALSAHVNTMLGRIDDLMQALREVSDNIAHDLKTPLTRLRNRAEQTLRDGPVGHREGLERIIEEADGLIRTFNALLLIARLEAGAIDETRTSCDLAGLVADAAELYQPVADDAGLNIVVDAPDAVPLAVNRQLVGQAVANLIDNAIKYSAGTPAATSAPIVVSVRSIDPTAAEITVADHGPGIASADRERVTRRFVRLEESRSRPGTGLGLSLVAAVARLHGGSIRFQDNAPGLRVAVVLTDPSARTAGGAAKRASAFANDPRRQAGDGAARH